MSYIREALQEIGKLPSPNAVQNLVVGRDFVYARFHKPLQGKESLLLPFDESKVDESPLFFLSERLYGTLEDLVIDSEYQNEDVTPRICRKSI